MERRSVPQTAVQRPTHCPSCQSKTVGTLAAQITTETFWRCVACGHGWRVGARLPGQPPPLPRRRG
jgi:ribosomal protein L37AE/L43A